MTGKLPITIYLIPGVGANHSVFHRLEFPDYVNVVPLHWVPHKHYEEPLSDYVQRLIPQINADTYPIYVGLSFGGIVAQTLHQWRPSLKTIIISSIKSRYERPLQMGLFRWLQLYRFFPGKLAVKFNFWHRWAFGQLSRDEKELINQMIDQIDISFNEWAVHQAILWDQTEVLSNVVHIHGQKDRIFPIDFIRKCYKIKGGTHFMIVNKSAEINPILTQELDHFLLTALIKNFQPKTDSSSRVA